MPPSGWVPDPGGKEKWIIFYRRSAGLGKATEGPAPKPVGSAMHSLIRIHVGGDLSRYRSSKCLSLVSEIEASQQVSGIEASNSRFWISSILAAIA